MKITLQMRKLILLSLLLSLPLLGFSQSNYTVSTMAGDTAGFADGLGKKALFNAPGGVAVDTAGNVYVADVLNNAIRKVATSGQVTTLAGDTAGYRNGADSIALFNMPYGLCVDDSGNVYVADTYNHCIRKIWAKTRIVTTVAGKDSAGYRNGPADSALFNLPLGVAVDSAFNLYVTDYGNNVVREISNTGVVSTLAGNDTIGYINGTAAHAEFYGIAGIALDRKANVYVTEIHNNSVRKISAGTVTTIAGFDTVGVNTTVFTTAPGYRNGFHDTAIFDNPIGIALDDTGNVYIADEYNNVIRKLRVATGMVSTVAGNTIQGYVDGFWDTAEFYNPIGLACDVRKGILYVGDNANNVIRAIYPQGVMGIKSIYVPAKGLAVYPNPCRSTLTIASAPEGAAQLFDITGRMVWSTDRLKAPYTLSIDGISPGMYFLHAGAASVKIIIER